MASDEYVCSGWACTDCLILLANGENPPNMTEDEISSWKADIETRNAGYNVTLGMMREYHACATNYTVTSKRGKTYEYRADSINDARSQFRLARESGAVAANERISATARHELRTAGDDGNDCECETRTFSSSACDYCGGNLGGERHAISFFKILA